MKKTEMAMCIELGLKEEYMQQFVEESGSTLLCDVKSEVGCSSKQHRFIKKWALKPVEDMLKQIDRLKGIIETKAFSMDSDDLSWARQRLKMVTQLSKQSEL